MGIPAWILSPRSLVVTAYHTTLGDEEFLTVTDRGNSHYVEKHMDKIGTESVVPTCDINLFRLSPLLDSNGDTVGTRLT